MKNTKLDEDMMALYGRYYHNEEGRTKANFDSGYTTQVTDDAIVDAVTSISPRARFVD